VLGPSRLQQLVSEQGGQGPSSGGGIGEHRVLAVSTTEEALRGDSAGAQSGTVELIGLGPKELN
jgi:hypothetical protein